MLWHNNGDGHFIDRSDEILRVNDTAKEDVNVGNNKGIDYDNDGDLDLFGRTFLLRNDRGQFVDVTEEAGLSGIHAQRPMWADFDRDGFIDFVFTPEGYSRLVFYRNIEGRTFRDVTADVGLGEALR